MIYIARLVGSPRIDKHLLTLLDRSMLAVKVWLSMVVKMQETESGRRGSHISSIAAGVHGASLVVDFIRAVLVWSGLFHRA